MKDYIELGPTPSGEDCAQLGKANYYEDALKECRAFRHQLVRIFGHPERFKIKAFQHDFGTYYEVVVKFDDEIEEKMNFAYDVEANVPEYWDDEAKVELK